jgi:hypothetical protein
MKIHCKWLLLCGLFTVSLVTQAQVRFQAESGILDAREWLANDRLPLAGYWLFYPNQFLTAHDLDSAIGKEAIVPALWNSVRVDGSGKGFGTYSLKVIVPHAIKEYTLEIPQLYNAYVMIINNTIVTAVGKIGTNKAETRPAWKHQLIKFSIVDTDTIHILLQIANFHHAKGGIKDQIFLGVPAKTEANFLLAKMISTFESGLLLMLGLFFIVLYFIKGQAVALYFAFFCVNWSVRAVFSNLYVVMDWFPQMRWDVLVRVEYMTLYIGMITAAAFLHHLFLKMGPKPLVTYILIAVNLMFVVFTLVASPAVFTKSVSLYVAIAGVTVGYGAIMVIRALFFEYAGAWFLMASILIGVMVFGYDIITYQTALAPNFIFLSIGYIAMFSFIAMGLLFQMNVLKSNTGNDILTFEDMMRK